MQRSRKKNSSKTVVFVESPNGNQITIEGASQITLTSPEGTKVVCYLQGGRWAIVSQ